MKQIHANDNLNYVENVCFHKRDGFRRKVLYKLKNPVSLSSTQLQKAAQSNEGEQMDVMRG